MDIPLGPNLVTYLRDGVASGRYSSAGEMVGSALALLRQREDEAREQALRVALQQGIDEADRGELVELDLADLIQEVRNAPLAAS